MKATSASVDPGDFPAGGGEMGRMIREFDWSATPLGAIEVWPQSLRTAVRIMLDSRYQMFVWWGSELTNFYNDAYISILGKRHPRALGQPASKIWHEVWDTLGPQTEQVMREGTATWNEERPLIMERNGYPEEAFFTFSYSPIPNDENGVGGVFCACSEDTLRVLAERRVRALRQLSASMVNAKQSDEAAVLAAQALSEHSNDVSFSLIYLIENDGNAARLAATAGIERGSAQAPFRADLSSSTAGPWPLHASMAGQPQTLTELDRSMCLPGGIWPEPAATALVLPLSKGEDRPSGFIVLGASPRRPFDDNYRGFFELVAGSVAAGVANAHAYEAEKKRAETLVELDKAKTAFFSNVSHEFRTPLTLMLGPVEDLLSRSHSELSLATKAELEVVHRNSLRLLKLVNTLLDFSRIEDGRVRANYQSTDLAALTTDLASSFRSACDRAGLGFVVDCPPLPKDVFVDREMWEKIVLNLASNAFKHTLEGEIRVTLTGRDGAAELIVQDSGTGIPAESLPRLFERFYRVPNTSGRTHEGTGIGLALVQELVKLHGGTVRVESLMGKGSAFIVSIPFGNSHLPRDRVDDGKALASTAMGALPYIEEALRWLPNAGGSDKSQVARLSEEAIGAYGTLAQAAGSRILLADDNTDMREYVRKLLSVEYEVMAVADGREALRAVASEKPDLVLTDVMMPNVDGFGLLKALRADPQSAAIPVIMLSARAGEESRVEGLDAGADDYLIKPFSARELLARVGGTLVLAKARREAVRREEELKAETNSILESITDGFIALDQDFRFTYVNAEAERINRIGRKDMLGRTQWEVFPATLGTRIEAEFRRAMAERVAAKFETYYEPWKRWLEIDVYPTNNQGLAVYFRDISDRKRAMDALQEADRRKDEFLANMSHEIRSPMTSILGYADILLSNLQDPDDIECVKTIKQSGDYLLEIINDILDLSKIESGKLTVQREPVLLAALLSEIHSLMAVRAKEKGLPLILKYDGLIPETILGDRIRLRQILINLISNGIKFTERGNVQIVCRYLPESSSLQFEVSDTGLGITVQMQARLFQPFTQADTSGTRGYGGTGLGLAITKRLVDMMRGSISFETELNRGTTFRIAIPVETIDDAKVRIPWIENRAAGFIPRQRLGCRVLVVDDRREIRYIARHFIEEAGGSVATVGNGQSAIDAVQRAEAEGRPIHLVLMDIQMPGLDGYETTRRLRAQGFNNPIIGLTAGAMKGDREKCLAAGCSDYLMKPIDRMALLEMVARYSADEALSDSEASPAKKSSLKILLVDDSVQACKATGRLLEMAAHEVRLAFNAASALTIARDFAADVAIVDLKLPDMSGWELLRRLQEISGLEKTRFIVLSGYDEASYEELPAVKFDYFLTKPVDLSHLKSLLGRINQTA